MNTPIPENTKEMFIDFFVGDSVKRVVRGQGVVCKTTAEKVLHIDRSIGLFWIDDSDGGFVDTSAYAYSLETGRSVGGKYTPKYSFDATPFSFFEVVEVEKHNYKERFLAKSHYRRLLNKTQNITSALASLIRAVENLDEPISNKQLEKELELSKSLLSTMENYYTNN